MITLEKCKTLSEVQIDNFFYRLTTCPQGQPRTTSILWVKDSRVSQLFVALGKFSTSDKRSFLNFVVRYSMSESLRAEIDRKRFEQKVTQLSSGEIEHLERLSKKQRELAYRNLFALDQGIQMDELDMKRRIMAKKFHPDAGGSSRIMSLINEAYLHLAGKLSARLSRDLVWAFFIPIGTFG